MADLATLADFEAYFGDNPAAEQGVRGTVLDQVEATFERECGRERAPFSVALTARVEKLTGTGTESLVVDYPIAVLTSVKLGFDSTTPDETLNVADRRVLVFEVGTRRLTRVDGGVFGAYKAPSYVEVTYNTQADLPADAKLAVLRRAAAIVRRRGSEDAMRESAADFSTDFTGADLDPVWMTAVAAHRRAAL